MKEIPSFRTDDYLISYVWSMNKCRHYVVIKDLQFGKLIDQVERNLEIVRDIYKTKAVITISIWRITGGRIVQPIPASVLNPKNK